MKTLKSIFNRFLNLITDTFEKSGTEKFSPLISYSKSQKENIVVDNLQNSWKLFDGEEFIGYIHSREQLNNIKELLFEIKALLFKAARNGSHNFRLLNFDNSIVVKIDEKGNFDHVPPSLFGGMIA